MSDASTPVNAADRPSGLWVRIGAVVIDFIAIHLALILIAIVAFPLTGGAVRMTNPAIAADCAPLRELPRGFEVVAVPGSAADEPAFSPNRMEICRMGFGPFDTHHYAYLAEEWPGGRYYQRALDPNGAITDPLIFLNDINGLMILLVLFLLEWRLGTTLGKAALGLQVEDRDGAALNLKPAFVRNVFLWGPTALLAIVEIAILWGRPFDSHAKMFGDRGVATTLVGLWP